MLLIAKKPAGWTQYPNCSCALNHQKPE
jgi:hypothetical protein